MLEQGGNAFDAAVCVAFCLNVLEPFLVGTGGEVPILLRRADGRVRALAGQGCAPATLTLDRACELGRDRLPGEGLASAVVPGALGAWLVLADELGSLPLPRLLGPAIDLAEGFEVYPGLAGQLRRYEQRLRKRYPTTAAVYLPDDEPPGVGDRLANPALARFYRRLAAAGTPGAAAALVYGGELGRELVAWTGAQGGLLTLEDLASWRPRFEETVRFDYRGATVHKCGPWSQGPVFLQQLALLQRWSPAEVALGDERSWHRWIECSKLAFADREAWYGDPDFTPVPLDLLLQPGYAARRASLVGEKASLELRAGAADGRPFGPPLYWEGAVPTGDGDGAGPHAGWGPPRGDTTHLDVADRHGNLVAATPSGGWAQSSPVIPELGFCLSTRAQMFHLAAGHPNAPAPRKRPRTTLTPSLARLPGGHWLAFGTPGGDCQDQWTLQAFLRVFDGGQTLHEACNAPALHSAHFPNSFWPREAKPGAVVVEGDMPAAVIDGLQRRGHRVEVGPPRSQGRCSFVRRAATGELEAAISQRHGHPDVGALD